MSNTETPAARWQREVDEKICQKIRLLQKEFEDINLLKQIVDQSKNLRKKLLTERCD